MIIVKYGEIALKGGNRPQFESALLKNLRWALRDVPDARVQRQHGRVVVLTPTPEQVLERIVRVFGVVGAAVAYGTPLELAAIQETCRRSLDAALAKGARSFKVDARRANKAFPLTSPELSSHLGGYLLASCPGAKVDVHNPDVVVHVEVRENAAYVYIDTVPGPGGLPVGVSNKGLLLISGGIDSPVAGWLAMRRGIALEAIHFHAMPYTSERARQKVLTLMEILAAYAGDITVHMVPFTQAQLALRAKAPEQLMITLMRRLMLRIATAVARERKIPALITGESVGQVASQTLESMETINAVTSMPIIRPLVAADKSEIVTLARRIGTYETSIEPYEDCCTLFVPKHPETRPRPDIAAAAEEKLDIDGMVKQCLDGIEVVTAKPHPAASLYAGGPIWQS